MLGKHVNVSARNKTIFMKFLRVFLAVVLLGLMIPHGISASLNAYAGDAEEQTTETTDPVVTEEDPVAEEEVTPAEPVPAAPVAGEKESNELVTPVIFVDFISYGLTLKSETVLPDGWSEKYENGVFQGIQFTKQYNTEDGDLPKYGDIMGQLDKYLTGAESADAILGIPDDVTLATFAYKIGQNININSPVVTNVDPIKAEPELAASITINVEDSVDTPTLWYSNTGKTREQYTSWPNSKVVSFLKYNTSYSVDQGTGHLSATVIYDHIIYDNFSGWCEAKAPYTFTKFTHEDEGGKIVPGLTFTAEFSSEATINFKTDLGASLPAGITFYKWDTTLATPAYVAANFTTATVDAAHNFVKSEVHPGTDGYVGGITIDGVEYAFKINETVGLGADYEFSKWGYSSDNTEYIDVGDSALPIGDNLYFKADFNIRLSFGTNDSDKGTVQKSEVDVTDPVYLAKDTTVTIDGNKVTITPDEYLATVKDADLYAFIGWEGDPDTFDMAEPTLLQANFATKPVVSFSIAEGFDDYLTLKCNGTAFPSTKTYVYAPGIAYKLSVDKTTLELGTQGSATYDKFTAEGDTHYAAFTTWTLEINGEEVTGSGTLADGDVVTVKANGDRIDDLTATGTITCGNPQYSIVRVDVLIQNPVTSKFDIKDTQFPTVGNDGKYTVENLPHDCYLAIYVENAGYDIYQSDNPTHIQDDAETTIPAITLATAYSYSYGKISDDYVWSDDTFGSKNINIYLEDQSLAPTPHTEGYYTFNVDNLSGNTTNFSLNASAGDVITFGNLHSNSLQGSFVVHSKTGGTYTTIQFNDSRLLKYTVNGDELNEGKLVFHVDTNADVDFISIDPKGDRIISFDEDSNYHGTGSFSETSITVPGYGVTCAVDSSNPNKLVFTIPGQDSKSVTVSTEGKSIFRHWNVDGTHQIIDSETITAKVVKAQIDISLKKESTMTPPTGKEWEDYGTTGFSVNNSTVEGQGYTLTYKYDKYNSVLKFANPQGMDPVEDKSITLDAYDKYYDTPFSGDTPLVLNDEVDGGVTINYRIIEKDLIDVTFKTNGATEMTGSPTAVTTQSGDVNWTHSTGTTDPYTEYYNKCYEDTAYADIVELWNGVSLNKPSGFFTGWDNQTGTLTQATTWTAQYDAAAWVSGKFYENRESGAQITGITGGKVTLTSSQALDPTHPAGTSWVVDVAADAYTVKVYEGIDLSMVAATSQHMECQPVTIAQGWTGDKTQNFQLDKGYTFFPKNFGGGDWTSYYNSQVKLPTSGASIVVGFPITLAVDGTISFANSNNLPMDPGDEIRVSLKSPESGSVTMQTTDGFDEPCEFDNSNINYQVWLRDANLTLKNTDTSALSINRLDYYIPWDTYNSVWGTATHLDEFDNETPLPGIDVSYLEAGKDVRELQKLKTTDTNGNYHVLLKSGTTGWIYLVDNRGDLTDDHLDERVVLDGTNDKELTKVMTHAIHVSGEVNIEKPGTEEPIIAAEGAEVSYSKDMQPPFAWNDYIHSVTYVKSDGTYSLKMAYSDADADAGGKVFFNLAGMAEGGHILQIDDVAIKHDHEITGMSDNISPEGCQANVVGTAPGHKYFTVKYYEGEHNYETIPEVPEIAVQKFAKYGEFSTTYGENGSLLKYVYQSPVLAEFSITVEPNANDEYTYWAWRVTDKSAAVWKTWTLTDQEKIDKERLATGTFTFTADYAIGTTITVGGAGSAGHAGWILDVSTGGDPIHTQVGTNDYTFTFPVSQEPEVYANETTETIEAGYSYDGQSFNLTLETDFESREGGYVHYTENRAFTPIPAEGYMFTGIAVNGVDLAAGEATVPIDVETGDLNVVAKYAEIPNVAQTGDNNNFWWLFALVAIALAGAAYAGTRKQKGIRR